MCGKRSTMGRKGSEILDIVQRAAGRPPALVAAAAAALLAFAAPAEAAVVLHAPATLVSGDRPGLRVSGLAPGGEVTVESYRTASVTVRTGDKSEATRVAFHARAVFWADARGEVALDTASPVAGTYTGADPRGLLWSGAVAGRAGEPDLAADAPELRDLGARRMRLQVRVGGQVVARRDLTLEPWAADVRFQTVDTPGLVGVFAAPAGARRRPTVVLLHGSEGGDLASAQASAGRWASRGYAAFALVYFAWPGGSPPTPNAPSSFTHLPVERIAAVRDWLRGRPEADVSRLGVAGGSKGGEYGLLAASLYPWIRAVAACVPSSLVWGGFGAPAGDHPESFTLAGAPIPYVPYGDYGPVQRGEITSTERHRRDRAAASPEALARAMIPVERSRARLLLISGGRDAVWSSDAMSAEVAARMARAGAAARVRWLSFPDSGHYLCGVGASPIRWDEADEGARAGGLLSAAGRDPGLAWEATLDFMREALAAPGGRAAARRPRARKTGPL